MRNNLDGIDFTSRILFASRWQAAERKVGEALIVDLPTAAPELGLGTPTLEEVAP